MSVILAPFPPYGRNKRNRISKVFISEVGYTRYNTLFNVRKDNRAELAQKVTEIITNEYEAAVINAAITESYPFLEDWERRQIEKYAIEEQKSDAGTRHREEIYTAVKAYLQDNDKIIPRGFADFRLPNLTGYITRLVRKSADRFFDEAEYEEFIALLRMLIEARETKESVIHILWEGSDVRLLNRRGKDVTEKYEGEFLLSAAACDAKSEDLAVSAIISAAPEAVMLHNEPLSSPLGQTLRKLFGDKCSICTGCNICKKH